MIQFVNLLALNDSIREELQESLFKYIDRTDYILGEEVELFEKEFAEYIGTKYAVGVSSGTDALFLALKVLDFRMVGSISLGNVILPVNTFTATALAVKRVGGKIHFVDIEDGMYQMDPIKFEEACNDVASNIVIPVHLYGQGCSTKIIEIANKYKLSIIEDCAQAHGSWCLGLNKKVGSIGKCGCFSFYPGKNLGGFGDGGMITTDDEDTYRQLLMLRNYGQKVKYEHVGEGYNMRLDTIQASVLRVKLRHLDKWNDRRLKIANLYNELLKDVDEVITPEIRNYHVFHLYVLKAKKRNKLLKFLDASEIQCGIHYPVPLHLQDTYKDLGYKKGSFPVAESIADDIISIPMCPMLKDEEIDRVTNKIKEFYR